MTTPEDRLRIADIIPRRQLRGAEIFAQHLEDALADRFEMQLFEVAAGELRAKVRAFEPDLIVAHGGDPLRAVARARLDRLAPVVYIKVSSVPERLRHGVRGMILRRVYGGVSAFVAVSESLREELLRDFGIPAQRVQVIPNGRPRVALSNAERSALRAEFGCGQDGFLVMWVGGMVHEKDPAAAVQVARELATRVPHARMVMIGDGPLLDETRASAEGVAGLAVVGRRDDAARCIAAGDVLLSTSITEGMPGVIIEALLAGVPVAAPSVGGIPETVGDGGRLTLPGDPAALAAILTDIANMPLDQRASLRERASERGNRFDIAVIAQAFSVLYQTVSPRRP